MPSALERLEDQLENAKLAKQRYRREVDDAARDAIGDALTIGSAFAAGYMNGADYVTTVAGINSNTLIGLGGVVGGWAVGGEAGGYVRNAGVGFLSAEAAFSGQEHGRDNGGQ